MDMLQKECLLRLGLLLCVSFGFLLHPVVTAVIPLGSKLSVVDNDCWVSSNGDFAFGFFNITDEPNQFSVGIRFNSKSIPYSQQTLVWIAGAHVKVSNMSYFQLTPQGELVLFDYLHGVTGWSSQTGNRSVVSAALHDNGNLVLMDAKQNVIWQSFDTPSDTLLPGQSLSVYETLRASTKDPQNSYYSLYLNASGRLQLRWESSVVYWTSESPSAANLTAFLTTDGSLQLRDQKFKTVWSVFGEDHNDSVSYRFLRLDLDGNLRLYSWTEASQSWRSVWQAVENQCKVFDTCGKRGVCVFNASGSAECRCPFKVTDTNICLVPYEQDCASGINMQQYKNIYLYGIYPPDDSVITSSLQQCEQLCLNDPRCTVATFSNIGRPQCSIKKTNYITGYEDPSLSSISFVKRCSGPLAVDPGLKKSPPPKPSPRRLCVRCIVGAASGTFLFFAFVQLGIVFFICRRKSSTMRRVTLAFTFPNSKGLMVLSFAEIKSITGDFKNRIGPNMFKGVLPSNCLVAIKDLNASIEERKFRSAVMKIGTIHHKNLVELEGYCCEFNNRYLVYEYAKAGSLDKYLDDPTLCKRLTWRNRIEICSSVAKAICYLHSGCREFISHGNLKCENVMLDEDSVAKVSEYGFAIINGEATYCGFSAEKDVGDFGKLVLTLLTGQRDHEQVCEWAYEEWMEGRVDNVVDKRIEGGANSEELERALRIAFWCVQMDEHKRPPMEEVARVLDGTLNVDPPPSPFQLPCNPQENGSESELESVV
ncbi:G-type lectin S-receptor-like serine/threonine-protein kinase [Trifolium pratense]|uniref:Receptor-like serine/threonine-protein kinase n=1 Tax=Trifolium pratense TaxID=57577 RepID=A0A2K3PKC0_TRIPR|nr:G-type lectin S-receptor-like serine/threonine-protein kinase [Trifolium pratense]PNY15738.1 G-type lectin S-receptor-like serine/threonine-protein kinase [Trifolium pratense]